MKINNQIEEIEKGCFKDIEGVICRRNQLCPDCREKLNVLKQFEKEIKGIQEEVEDLIDCFFKKKFYNPTTQDNMDFEELKQEIKKRFG